MHRQIINLKRILVSAIVAVVTVSSVSANAVFAAGASAGSYVTGDDNYRQPVPDCYIVMTTVNNFADEKSKTGVGNFNDPRDIFIDDNDNIYVTDTGNNRIVKLDKNFKTVGIYYGPGKGFKKPEGLYVDKDGDMYVADTENSRIVHLSRDGEFVEEFGNPESNLNTGESFNPRKLLVSTTGYIYVVRGEHIMAIDGTGAFRGYYGQTNIGYSLTDVLMRMFASDEQKLFAKQRLASAYKNICYGDDGMIYAVADEREEGEIKQLNSIGTNIYRKYKTIGNTIRNPFKDFINNKILKTVVAGQSFKFGEYFDDYGNYMEPNFVDICTDKNGIVTVVEQTNGKVYQYDQDGRMLVAFGGLGEQKGTFQRPVSLDVDSQGNIYVLDQTANNIQIFEPTEFINLIHAAASAYNDGDYQKSYDLWRKVLATDENYSLAHVGIARSYYKQGEYKKAMEESKIVRDRDIYTMAFDKYKYEVMRDNFFLIVVLAVAIVIAVFFLIKLFLKHAKKGYWSFLREKNKKMGFVTGIEYAFNIVFRPIEAIQGLKWNRSRVSWTTPIFILVLAYLVRMAYVYVVHFPLQAIEIENVNIWFEMMKLWIVPLSWVPASFMATSISGGESKMKEIFFASAASLCPFILINFPLMFLSHLMSKTQKNWYGVFGTAAIVLMVFILFVAMKELNNYSFWKAVGMMLVSGFLMLILWLVILLCYVLTGRMIQFVISIIDEFRLNFL